MGVGVEMDFLMQEQVIVLNVMKNVKHVKISWINVSSVCLEE